jgi:signal transduction histidine kinase
VVRVRTHGDASHVTLDVHNGGTPIPEADLARLFEPFQRGTDVHAGSTRSVGLGLYISKEIAIAHGGTIEVRSSAQEGTRFTVRLPRYNPG